MLIALTRFLTRSGWLSRKTDATSALLDRWQAVMVAFVAMLSFLLFSPACSSVTMSAEPNIAFLRSSSMQDTLSMTSQALLLSSIVLPVSAISLTAEKQADSKMVAAIFRVVSVSPLPPSKFPSSIKRSMAVLAPLLFSLVVVVPLLIALSPPLRNGSMAARSPGSSAMARCCAFGKCLTMAATLSRPAPRCFLVDAVIVVTNEE